MKKEDFDHLKELQQRNIISEKSYVKRVVDFGKLFLERHMKLEILELVEIQSYGGKLIARESGSSIKLEAKVVIAEKCPEQDVEIWPTLKHPNILRLLDKQCISRADAHIFITEYYFFNLENFLQNDAIMNNQESPQMVKQLLLDILGGLEYLHDRGCSHLALKPRNILISRKNKAVISDFSSLGPAKQIPKNTRVPLNYGPPELYFRNDFNENVYGASFDIWSFGILALNIFTNGYIQNKIPEDADWRETVYPTLFKILQIRKFSKYIEKAFPSCTINKASKKIKINFIITCLRIIPTDRPSPDLLMKHKYFVEDGGFITIHKAPWYKKCNFFTGQRRPLGTASAWIRNRLEATAAQHFDGKLVDWK